MDQTTVTPVSLYVEMHATGGIDAVLCSLREYYLGRRDALLRELASIERELGYGGSERPTTAQIRNWWRRQQHENGNDA